jgi:hypothetical protein
MAPISIIYMFRYNGEALGLVGLYEFVEFRDKGELLDGIEKW